MQNTVTRLRPRRTDYRVAVQAFLDGDSLFCIEALSGDASPQAAALQARSLSRLEQYSGAAALLDSIDVTELSHEYAAELLAVRGAVAVAMHDPLAEALLTDARARAYSSGFKPLESEVEVLAGLVAWSQRRSDEASAACERALEIGNSAQWFLASQRTDYVFTVGYWRARAHDLLGLVHAGNEDYEGQASCLARAFDEFDASAVADSSVEKRMLVNLAVLVRDLDSDRYAGLLEERAERAVWSSQTAAAESVVYHAIGMSRAKRGDHLGAFRHLRRSANCAPNVPLQIKAIVDRSFIAREIGEVFSAQDDFEHALKLAKQTDWENAPGMQRAVLFELARQLASIDPKNARILWERYASLKSAVSGFEIAGRGDRRQRAFECCAHAAVLTAESQSGRAISLLLDSLQIFTEVGYHWRAAAVALDLAELTGEPRYVAIAEREAAKYPNSSLARRLAALKVPATA